MSHYVAEGFKTLSAATALTAYTAVKLDANGRVIAAAAATDIIVGVVHKAVKAPQNGQYFPADIRLRSAEGTMNIQLSGTVAAGAAVTSDASGKGVATTTAGNQLLGYALEAGVAGDVIEILPTSSKY
jgi:hypothetical protein